jgi:CRP/FNR family cyclic AMP-dependent transcriptional regulator
MRTLEPVIAGQRFFKGLDPQYVKLITDCAVNMRFNGGDFVFRAGDEADRFYLIRDGRIALEEEFPGRGPVLIQTIDAGEVFGWSWLFPPYRRHYSARALGLMRVLAFDGACLRAKCESDHDLGYDLMKRFAYIVVQRLQATRLQMLDIYSAHEPN